MRLTQFSDYSLRVLLYLGLKDGQATVAEIAKNFKISRNHLTKVVYKLGQKGFIATTKGKGGGFRLAVDPEKIRIGDFLRDTEPDFHFVECFDRVNNRCPIQGVCGLENLLYRARREFFEFLNRQTLADLLASPDSSARKKKLKIR